MGLFRFMHSSAPIVRGASEVEAAYRAFLTDLGYTDDDTYGQINLGRIGEFAAGVLWQAWQTDSYGDGWWAHAYIVDTGETAEAIVAMSEDGGDVALHGELSIDAEVVKSLGTDRAAWTAALSKALDTTADEARRAFIKSDAAQRYTLGVAYPADDVDSHGDYTDATELEKAAWLFMSSGQAFSAGAGVDHADGTDLAGTVVESYIYRGPDWNDAAGNPVAKDGDWMLGTIWTEDAWGRIERQELTGYSMQGLALVEDNA